MSHLETLLRHISAIFNDQRQEWALVGGLAVSVLTEPRFTRDLDIAVAVSDDRAAEAFIHCLHTAGFRVIATVEQDATHRLATARLAPLGERSQGLMLDLLFASSGIEKEICEDSQLLEVFPQFRVPVARLHHLIVLKTLARDDITRPQDVGDLRQLIRAADPSDLKAACDAARLIEDRGFNRSRNMVAAISTTWQEFRP